MAAPVPIQDIGKKFEKWCRLVSFVEEGGKSVCKKILHTRMGVPEEGAEMYKYLQRYKAEIKRCSELQPFQENILLPCDKVIDVTKLDLPLYTYIVQILDKSEKYPLIKALRYRRNDLIHMEETSRDMCKQKFEKYWDEVSQLLRNYNDGMELMENLKTDTYSLNQESKKTLRNILHSIETQGNDILYNIQHSENCLVSRLVSPLLSDRV